MDLLDKALLYVVPLGKTLLDADLMYEVLPQGDIPQPSDKAAGYHRAIERAVR